MLVEMHDPSSSCPCVVVGIDGSRAAMQATMWSVDEAIDRDIPLHLLYAIDSDSNDPDDVAAAAATADRTVHNVLMEIQSEGKPVKVESEVVHARPIPALLEASRSAAMVCVGSIGFKHATRGRIGSTASTVATFAHCPVAIVPRTTSDITHADNLILAVIDGSPGDDRVLERAVEEARLRNAVLRVFTTPQAQHGERNSIEALPERTKRIERDIEHRLTHWRRNHPHLDVRLVSDHADLLNYLEYLQRKSAPPQLVIADSSRPGPADALLSPAGRATLEATACTLMLCDRRWWL
ncbi:MAG TPA: universal stress protein [Mycobacterium sp.]